MNELEKLKEIEVAFEAYEDIQWLISQYKMAKQQIEELTPLDTKKKGS